METLTVEGIDGEVTLPTVTLTFSAPVKMGPGTGEEARTWIQGNVNGKYAVNTLSEDGLTFKASYGGFGNAGAPITHVYSWSTGGFWGADGTTPVVDTQVNAEGAIRACPLTTHTQSSVQNPSTEQQNNAG